MSFITHLLNTLDDIKVYHWQTKSYARHKASDRLHSGLEKLVDLFVETYLGEHEKRPDFSNNNVIDLHNCTDEEAYAHLKKFCTWLKTDLTSVVGDSLALKHILEEMCTLVEQTAFLYTLIL